VVQRVFQPVALVRLRLRPDEPRVARYPQQRDRRAGQLLQPQERVQPEDPGRQLQPDQDPDQAVPPHQPGVNVMKLFLRQWRSGKISWSVCPRRAFPVPV